MAKKNGNGNLEAICAPVPRAPRSGDFKPGNRASVGHGRPPNPGFEDEALEVLGKELMQWMEEVDADPKANVVHLSQFYAEKKKISPTQWKDIVDRERFSSYYDIARVWMGRKLLQNERLPQSYGNRFLGMYFRDLRADEEAVKDRQAERDKGIAKMQSENLTTLIASAKAGEIKQSD